MDFKAALKRIKALEVDDAAELASAIEGEVDRLNSKNYTIIGEKRDATTKAQSMQSALEAIAKALGIEGDIDAILEGTQGKVTELVSEAKTLRETKTTLETRATEAEGKVAAAERKSKLSEIATKAGANAAVLEKLLADKVDEIAIADDGTVKLGDKPLKEYVEGDDTLKAFAPALFPSQSTTEKPKDKQQPNLPSGSPGGGKDQPDLVSSYFTKAYTGIKQFGSKS
ncbi:MAG: hypothetical protein F6K42_31135 [Leptolyngbya sp. SIO1D8]|nr:hypothetical protein [Leptolyngbya sp. SIO1D8]